MLLVGLASCSQDDPVAPEAVVAGVDEVLSAPPSWQGFSPTRNNRDESTIEVTMAVGDRASGRGATPIVNGHGNWATGMGTVGFQVSVVEFPDGTINGHGMSTMQSENGNGWVHFNVVDAAPYGDEIAVLGLITDAVNAPLQFIGSLTVLIIRDNGRNESDMALSGAGLPPSLSLDNILYGPTPPPSSRLAVAHGNFMVH